ncbi:MAG: signal peptidase I [Chloroflexi bacterium]|nr:signal peptidase I [Chloroflexota bacterium]MCI0802677.1 signal peptidase I [Chloroflexota bacterium]MCI0830845.1 signal peptidase I [Chloroflexota bacterium]MCI0848947.1 signal peptidase I [Chloroflexota bacterium]MCI0901772.1 signal peptidase I [Chloroflexota bacterium]
MSRVAREIIEAVVLAAVVFMLLQTTVRNFKVDGSSMDPTLEDGQYLLVNRLVYLRVDLDRLAKIVPFWQASEESSRYAIRAPERGEVIVFEFPDKNAQNPRKDFVKRVIGLPGESIEMKAGTVFVNGDELDEPYLTSNDRSNARLIELGEGEYYVLGDNRAHSNDSRSWGAVPEANLRGKVWMVYWPAPKVHILNILDRIPGFG